MISIQCHDIVLYRYLLVFASLVNLHVYTEYCTGAGVDSTALVKRR